MSDAFENIKETIRDFQQHLEQQMPAIAAEVNALIANETTDSNTIEHTLDSLLSLTEMGVGKDLYIRLLEYYKTIDAAGADFYWNEYDKEEE
jgi:N-acetylglucosamine kinase-like BadF-type ATPase